MTLLASGITSGNKIIIIVLCIAVVIFLIADLLLLVTLHKRNKKIAKNRDKRQVEADNIKALSLEEEQSEEQSEENNETEISGAVD